MSGPDTLASDSAVWGLATLMLGGLLHLTLGRAAQERRRALQLAAALLASLGWVSLTQDLSQRASGQGPNILLVTLDTLRADHVGQKTPALRALMADGASYSNAVTTAPLTAPAHASMLTGRTTPEHGLTANGDTLDLPTVVPQVAEQGYATAAFLSSKVLERGTGLDQGFDLYADVWSWKGRQGVFPWMSALLGRDGGDRRGDDTVRQALNWWRAQEGPRFAWVHLYDIHSPYAPPPEWGPSEAERRALVGPSTPAPAGAKEWMQTLAERHGASQTALYAAEVAYTDHLLGQLLEAVGPDTVVIVLSDHGEGFGEHDDPFLHGANLYEPALHVPFVVRWSDHIDPGPRDALISVQAVAGVLAEASGASWDTPGLEAQANSVLAFTPGQRSRGGVDDAPATLVAALRFQDSKLVQEPGEPGRGYDLAEDPEELQPLEPTWVDPASSARLDTLLESPPEPLDADAVEQLKALGYISP